MRGDRYIFLDSQIPKAKQIAKEIFKKFKSKGKIVVSLGGESGTNKSEISVLTREILHEKYKVKSFILHQDDYYKVLWFHRNKWRKEFQIIGKEELNWKKIDKIITAFKENQKKIYVQEIDIFLDIFIHHVVPCKNTIDVLILEGLYACYAKADYKIYLEGTLEDTYQFRKKRMKEDPDDKFRQFVLKKESNCVKQSKKYANLIMPYE